MLTWNFSDKINAGKFIHLAMRHKKLSTWMSCKTLASHSLSLKDCSLMQQENPDHTQWSITHTQECKPAKCKHWQMRKQVRGHALKTKNDHTRAHKHNVHRHKHTCRVEAVRTTNSWEGIGFAGIGGRALCIPNRQVQMATSGLNTPKGPACVCHSVCHCVCAA